MRPCIIQRGQILLREEAGRGKHGPPQWFIRIDGKIYPLDRVTQGPAIPESMVELIPDPDTPRERVLRQAARDLHEDEGTLEIDDNAIVSEADASESPHGAYVAAWVWVDYEDAGMTPPEA